MKVLLSLLLLVGSMSQLLADDLNESQLQISNFGFTEGEWYLVNSSDLRPQPQHFYVKMKIEADGHMLTNSWHSFKPGFEVDEYDLPNLKTFKRNTEDFGLVLKTYDPAKAAIITSYFNIGTSTWNINEAMPIVSEGLIETEGYSVDGYGSYQYYTRLEKVSDDRHEWTSQRLYESLGFWLTVDSYVATRIK